MDEALLQGGLIQLALGATREPLLVIANTGVIAFCNAAASQTFKQDADSLPGEHIGDLIPALVDCGEKLARLAAHEDLDLSVSLDGEPLPKLIANVAPLGGKFGQTSCQGALITLSDRRQASLAEALRESQQRLDIALASSRTGIWDWYPDTDELREYGYWADRWNTAENDAAPHTGNWLMRSTHPDDIAGTREALTRHLKGQAEAYECRQRIRNKQGAYEHILSRGTVIDRDERGRAKRVMGTYTDVAELARYQRQLEAILDGSGQGAWEYEVATDTLSAVGEWHLPDIDTQLEPPFPSVALLEFMDAREAEQWRAKIADLLRGKLSVAEQRFRFRRTDGAHEYFLIRATVTERDSSGYVHHLAGTFTNITALIAADETLRIALENGHQGTWDWYPESDKVECSSYWYVLLGYPDGHFKTNRGGLSTIIHPDDLEISARALVPMLKGERDDYQLEMRFRHREGHYIWMLSRGRAIQRDSHGRATRVVGSHVDISENKKRQEQIQMIANAMTSGDQTRLLNALTQAAAELSGMDYAAITLANPDGTGTVTSCYPQDAGLRGYTYVLKDSPCRFSFEQETQIITSELGQTFPADPAIKAAGIEAYVGRRLVDSDGELCGIFALMNRSPITRSAEIPAILDVFATRAASELQREQAHAALSAREQQLNAALEGSQQGVWEWRADDDAYDFRSNVDGTLPNHEIKSGSDLVATVHPDDQHKVRTARQAYFRGKSPIYEYEARQVTSDGSYRWFLTRGKATERDSNGRILKMLGTHTDITPLKVAEAALGESQSFLRLIVDTVPQFIFWQDDAFRYTGCNQQFAELAGFTIPDQLIGKTDQELWWGSDVDEFLEDDRKILNGDIPFVRHQQEIQLPQGETHWFETIKVPMKNESKVVGILGTLQDITERKEAENEAQRLAFYDPLTNLPNRRFLSDTLHTTLAAAERRNQCGALLFIDLDRFKEINDTLGHSVGDDLLKLVARRLQQVTRSEDTVARLGGDEFVVLLAALNKELKAAARHTQRIAEKIRHELTAPYRIDGQVFHVTPTIGITMFPDAGKTVDDVLKEADTAMYSGKAEGRNTTRFFHRGMEESARYQLELEQDSRNALIEGQFALHYQPQVNAEGAVIGSEALLRWEHPSRGNIPPADFIPVAEDRGLIVEIGNWVLATVFETVRDWLDREQTAFGSVSINVSSRQFRDRNFVNDVSNSLRTWRIPPNRIILEITDSTIIDNVQDTVEKMSELRQLGLRFALDDFGVGYSSLTYLKKLPIDQIKIDRSFIRDIGSDPNDEVICQTIIAMGEHLGLQTIAEGVETDEQFTFLRSNYCDGFQGFKFLMPCPEAEFLAFCQSRQNIPHS
ncbi:MAG: EAL domain-containing protein [Pseudomonadota bacterium]